ncbi:MAG: triose-phosphate isomerase [Candidatus Pelagibacter sp. TMED128]|nr:MAG: triose-phosphate isomerase [Candidatus Pelagibacter sp. TMED128]|tara:strand:+ start:155 stop:901 length:747 start_codon:yes stop_codon:yes gene_type:complete
MMKYFIGNWKMFGVPRSIKILNRINSFRSTDSNRNKYRIVITPPYTLLETFAKKFRDKKIIIGSQNCYQKEKFSSNTAAISPYMIRAIGAKYTLVGHSDNRAEGDTNTILKDKVKFALQNNLKVVFCIGENKLEKKNNKTFSVLKNQLVKVLESKFNKNNIIVAYEPIWSIGTGKIPSYYELLNTSSFIKKTLKKIFKKGSPEVLYGGSVDEKNVHVFREIKEIDGFLIGGASKSSKKFIDIIKNYYR